MVMNQNKDPTNIKEAWTENLVNDLTTPQSISGHSLFPIQANTIQSNNYISKPKHYNSFATSADQLSSLLGIQSHWFDSIGFEKQDLMLINATIFIYHHHYIASKVIEHNQAIFELFPQRWSCPFQNCRSRSRKWTDSIWACSYRGSIK